jgi:hypothetical protein
MGCTRKFAAPHEKTTNNTNRGGYVVHSAYSSNIGTEAEASARRVDTKKQ